MRPKLGRILTIFMKRYFHTISAKTCLWRQIIYSKCKFLFTKIKYDLH